MSKEYASATKIWKQMKEAKYSDEEIKHEIALGWPLKASAMIAYNEMIDRKIERARKTWKGG